MDCGATSEKSLLCRRRLRSETISQTRSILTPWRRCWRICGSIPRAARASPATSRERSMRPADELRVSRQETQQIDVLEHADELATFADGEAALVVLRHAQERGRHQVVRRDANDRSMRERTDGAVGRAAVAERGVEKIRAGYDSDALGRRHKKSIRFVLAHQCARVSDRLQRVDKDCRMKKEFVDAHAQKRREARRLLFARDGVELVGDVEIEERGEARVPVDERKSGVAGQDVAQCLLARDERIGAAALHHGARSRTCRRARAARQGCRGRAPQPRP